MLSEKIEYYKCTGKMLRNTPAKYKTEFEWLKEIDAQALCNAQMHLEQAYRNFFRDPKIGFPKYKCKHDPKHSYTTNVINRNVRIEGNRLRLPKVGLVKIRLHREMPDDWQLKSVTISRESTGRYYASLLFCFTCNENQVQSKPEEELEVLGIDFAMSGMAVFSDGTRADYPMFYRKAEKKLAREQRRLSHCKKGGKNYQKQKQRLARAHAKVRNQRKDFHHKLSHQIALAYDVVAVEDLDMKAMSKSMHFGKSVMDDGYGMFCQFVERKLTDRGKAFVKVDRFYPSSKKCSCCGRVKQELSLADRVYHCTCGNTMDRDVNAAVNIREEGKRLLCTA